MAGEITLEVHGRQDRGDGRGTIEVWVRSPAARRESVVASVRAAGFRIIAIRRITPVGPAAYAAE